MNVATLNVFPENLAAERYGIDCFELRGRGIRIVTPALQLSNFANNLTAYNE